jgi:DOPA 4,5-dioxygenase
MSLRNPSTIIDSCQARVPFGVPVADAAWALCEVIVTVLAGRMEVGRFHERPAGPHTMPSHALNLAAHDA